MLNARYPRSSLSGFLRARVPLRGERIALLVALVAVASSCGERLPDLPSGALATGEGIYATTVDRSRPLAPGVAGQEGGTDWVYVNLWSGNLLLVVPLLRVPALGPDWNWDLYYNSILADESTTLGPGWRHTFEVLLLIADPDPNSITVRWGDGRRDVFVWDGSGWASPGALHAMRIEAILGGYRLGDKNGLMRVFNPTGRLTAFRDRNGNEMTFAYDGLDRLVQVMDATGRSCTLGYTAEGQLESIAGLDHPSLASFEYDQGLLVRAEDRAGNATLFSYDAFPLLVSVTDPDGDGVAITYDPGSHAVIELTRTDGVVRRFRYDALALETSVLDQTATGESETIYRFDTASRVEQVTDGPAGTSLNTYDAANNLLTHTDPGGHTATMTFSPEGDLVQVQDATGATTGYTYDPVYHLVVTVQDPMGYTWTGTRDGNGNLTTWTDPLGYSQSYTYDVLGQLTSSTDRRGNTTTYAYDAAGNLASVTDPAGYGVSATYNARGVPLTFTDQQLKTYTFALTARDEIASVTLPAGRTYQFAWNPSGTLASVTDPLGAVYAWAYNTAKQVTSRTDPLGFAVSLVRDGAGNLTQAINELGNAVLFSRDLAGRLTAIRDADGGITTYSWDCCDVIERTNSLGTMYYAYSARHELVGASAGDGSIVASYGYDPVGRLTEAQLSAPPNPIIQYSYSYDAAGRLVTAVAGHLGRTASYWYDPDGNVLRVEASPEGTAVDYTYDNRSLPLTVSSGSPPLVAELDYKPNRLIWQIDWSNGAGGLYTYDVDDRLVNSSYTGPGFAPIQYHVNYDQADRPTMLRSVLPAPIGVRTRNMDWDARGLPATVEELPAGGVTSFLYDQAWDRMSEIGPGGTVTYDYTAAQRMVTAGTTTLDWNPAGGCTEVNEPGGTTTLVYRADGALESLTKNGQTWSFLVGPLGETARVTLPGGEERWQVVDAAGGVPLRRCVLSAGGQPLEDVVQLPVELVSLHLTSLDPRSLTGLDPWVLRVAYPETPQSQSALLPDPLGTIGATADGNGNLAMVRYYGLFGDLLAHSGPQDLSLGFLGMDVEEGLAAPYFAGLLADQGHPEANGAGASGVGSVCPYLPETGSFLFDRGFGSDALMFVGGQEDGGGIIKPWVYATIDIRDYRAIWASLLAEMEDMHGRAKKARAEGAKDEDELYEKVRNLNRVYEAFQHKLGSGYAPPGHWRD